MRGSVRSNGVATQRLSLLASLEKLDGDWSCCWRRTSNASAMSTPDALLWSSSGPSPMISDVVAVICLSLCSLWNRSESVGDCDCLRRCRVCIPHRIIGNDWLPKGCRQFHGRASRTKQYLASRSSLACPTWPKGGSSKISGEAIKAFELQYELQTLSFFPSFPYLTFIYLLSSSVQVMEDRGLWWLRLFLYFLCRWFRTKRNYSALQTIKHALDGQTFQHAWCVASITTQYLSLARLQHSFYKQDTIENLPFVRRSNPTDHIPRLTPTIIRALLRTNISNQHILQCPSVVHDHPPISQGTDSNLCHESKIPQIKICPTHPPNKSASPSPQSEPVPLRLEPESLVRASFLPPSYQINLHSKMTRRKDSSIAEEPAEDASWRSWIASLNVLARMEKRYPWTA